MGWAFNDDNDDELTVDPANQQAKCPHLKWLSNCYAQRVAIFIFLYNFFLWLIVG